MAEQNTTTVAAEIEPEIETKFREEGSPITDAENSKKKLGGSVEERPRNVNAAECDIVPSASRPKRKCEPPKNLDDYEQNTPDSSPISEGSTDEDLEISLDELLDKLHKPLATEVNSTASQPPPTVSHWSQPYNDGCVRKYFKMRRHVVSPEGFIVRYIYGGSKALYERNMDASGLSSVLDFLAEVTSCVDTTDTELFLPSSLCDPEVLSNDRNQFCDKIDSFIYMNETKSSKCQDEIENQSNFGRAYYNLDCKHIVQQAKRWLRTVGHTVKLSPTDVDETAYVEVFKRYLDLFHLSHIDGKGCKLGIPYETREVMSVPDLIVRKEKPFAPFFGVVEVKKMTLVPALKHAYEEPPKRGILNISGEGPNPSKKRCVNFPLGASASSTREESDEVKQQDESDLGSPLTESQRRFIEIFFGQLFGHALALDCRAPRCLHWHGSYKASQSPQRLGIGVVGFREIPCVGRHRMNVFMTSELSLLNASDRREINKILLALSTSEPVWTTRLY